MNVKSPVINANQQLVKQLRRIVCILRILIIIG